MPENNIEQAVLIDGSRLIIESLSRSGADAFIGYPITPANLLYYYAGKRMDLMLAAPDEITTLQWMSGLAATGKLPVTATSFPGFALMLESVNMAYMMELPMVIVLVQRLGPATGTATCGAQGDLLLLRGMISGGHPIPVLAPSSYEDCWTLPAKATEIAVKLRTPVILLTSKEEVMTQKSFDISRLSEIAPVKRSFYDSACTYKSYKPDGLVPAFLPAGNDMHQVRLNASTHDQTGILQHSSPEALDNTRRLEEKVSVGMSHYTFYDYDEQEGAEKLIVAYGISAQASREAVNTIRSGGGKASLLIPKTILPLPEEIKQIIDSYKWVLIAEESMNNQFGDILYGRHIPDHVRFTGSLGKMITPDQIIQEVEA